MSSFEKRRLIELSEWLVTIATAAGLTPDEYMGTDFYTVVARVERRYAERCSS
jgi:hypothetical protein